VDDKANLVLVDLRRPNEYQAGHLPGALSVPIADLEKRYGEIPTAEQVVLYCQCPTEDLVSAFLFLRSKGHANLAVLEDGFDGWLRRRYPIVK
jgi:rhodanese-related sulfurtransferase